MTQQPVSDALVFFGATGDLAFKQIFPSLQRLAKRDKLKGPVVGVAKSVGELVVRSKGWVMLMMTGGTTTCSWH